MIHLEKPFQGSLDMLRASIKNTNFTNWQSAYRNAAAHVANILDLVNSTQAIDSAALQTISEAQSFARSAKVVQPTGGLEEKRLAALSAIDRFAEVLEKATPSDTARALGLGF